MEDVRAVILSAAEPLVPGIEHDDDLRDVLALELRPRPGQIGTKGRELDPRKFNYEERQKFKESSAKNWDEHLKHGAVRVVPPEEAKQVPKDRIFSVPARFVHTWKDGAKSRFVIPGHTDPDKEKLQRSKKTKGKVIDEEYRTDAPVGPQLALRI